MFEHEIALPPPITLRDGRLAEIRPLIEDDYAALLAFGRALPADDWIALEDDFQNPEIVRRLANAAAADNWRQRVAIADDQIVGYSIVRRMRGWSSHVGEVGLIVAGGWRRSGLGTALAQATFEAAHDLGVAKVTVAMLEQQIGGRAIFERLGFRAEGQLDGHVRDRHGSRHALLLLSYAIH